MKLLTFAFFLYAIQSFCWNSRAEGLIFMHNSGNSKNENLTSIPEEEVVDNGTTGEEQVGNRCPVTAPWPCQQFSFCLSFDFVCDGEIDCPDGYDENPQLCVAKNRPGVALLENFIRKYRDWLVPDFLGDGDFKTIANNLAISQSLEDYGANMQLSSAQTARLGRLLEEVVRGRQIGVLMFGMPLQSWPEVYTVLRPVARGLLTASAAASAAAPTLLT